MISLRKPLLAALSLAWLAASAFAQPIGPAGGGGGGGGSGGSVAVTSIGGAADPCMFTVKSQTAIATSAGNFQLVAPVAAKRVYLCSLVVVSGAAWIGNVIEGTGAACTTANEAAVIGSTTAASGMSFAANGGFVYPGGGSMIASTQTAANGLCLLQSGTAALAGIATWVQQ